MSKKLDSNAEYKKKWYQATKPERQKYFRMWYAKNRGRLLEHYRKYYKQNREAILKKAAQRRNAKKLKEEDDG